jgi:phosphate:Na+ symporter
MADVLEAMLRNALDAIDRGDRKLVSATKGLDNVLDRLNGAIKAYLTALDPDVLDEEDNRRLAEILAFATNLEHAGDHGEGIDGNRREAAGSVGLPSRSRSGGNPRDA